MDLFSRIKALCDKHEVSPTKLGLELGFSKDTINSWKTKSPSADKLQKVADYFNVSTDYLLGRTPYKRPTDDPDLVWGYGTLDRDLTPDELEQVKSYVEMMIKAHDSEKKDK